MTIHEARAPGERASYSKEHRMDRNEFRELLRLSYLSDEDDTDRLFERAGALVMLAETAAEADGDEDRGNT